MGIGFSKSQNSKGTKSNNTKQRNEYSLTSDLKTVRENGQSREIPQRNSPPQRNNNYDDSVFDDIEDEYYDDVEEQTPPRNNNRKKQQMQYVPQQKKSHKGTVFLMVVILLLLLGGFGVLYMKNNNANNSINNSTNSVIPDSSKIPDSTENKNVGTTQNDVSSEDETQGTTNGSSASGTLIKENEDGSTSTIPESSSSNNSTSTQNSASAGLPNFNVNTNMKSDSAVTDYSEFVKNLQGDDVKVDYTVSRIDTKQDFVNYTKYRTVTGTGIELYWLDVIYKDRSYTITVPFKIYKELDDVGIVPVNMEVLILTDNSEIISYMEVNTDYEGGTK